MISHARWALPLLIVIGVWQLAAPGRANAQPVLERVEQLLRNQIKAGPPAAEPGYLGLIGDEAEDAGRGVRVVEVFGGGPAAQAGVANGDLITQINGQQIRVMDDMAKLLDGKTAGTRLTVSIIRGGTARDLSVMLGRRPATPPAATEELPLPATPPVATPTPAAGRLGVRTIAVTEEVRRQAGLVSANGAHVVSVAPGSPAARGGIPTGAVITAVNGTAVDTPDQLASVVRAAGSEVDVIFMDRGAAKKSRLELPAAAGATAAGATAPQSRVVARPTQPAPAPARNAPAPSSPVPTTPAPVQPTPPPPVPDSLQAKPPAKDLPATTPNLGEKVQQLATRQAELLERIETLEAEIARLKAAQAEAPK